MTARSQAPISRVVLALIRNQWLRYLSSLVMWITIWTAPIIVGLLIAAFFDQLTGETAGWNLATIVAVLWAYLAARIGAVFVAMRLHSGLLFRAGAGMRGSMLAWIFSLPGARPVAETPGEVVSRFVTMSTTRSRRWTSPSTSSDRPYRQSWRSPSSSPSTRP